MIRFRCEIAVPSGLRRTRLPVRLEPDGAEGLVLLPARGPADATHQLVDAAGTPLLTLPSERDPGVATELARAGIWELSETLTVLAAVRPGTRLIDVGAQTGYYAALAARQAGAAGRVYAFDPSPDHAQVLAANAALTALLDPGAAPIEVIPFALADRPGNVRLYLSDRAPGEHSTIPTTNAVETRVVPSATLDDLRWPADGPPRLDGPVGVLKVDVVGGEEAVLRGARRVLATDRPVVAVTVRPGVTGPEPVVALVEFLAGLGYASFRHAPPAAPEPYLLLAEAARAMSPAEVSDAVRRRLVAPRFGLVAYPGSAPPDAH